MKLDRLSLLTDESLREQERRFPSKATRPESHFSAEATRPYPRNHVAALWRTAWRTTKYVDRGPHGAEEQTAYEKHGEKLSRSERPMPI
jgi:hypothetical protein